MVLDYPLLYSRDYYLRKGNTLCFESCAEQHQGSLSFVAAFFALNVGSFPKSSDGTTTIWQIGHILGLVGMQSSSPIRPK